MKPQTLGTIITDSQASKYFGCVYLVQFPTLNKRYIGQRSFKAGTKVDDWKTYRTSSKHVQALLDACIPAKWSVISFAISKRQLGYLETSTLHRNKVLEDLSYLNECISGRYFRKSVVSDLMALDNLVFAEDML